MKHWTFSDTRSRNWWECHGCETWEDITAHNTDNATAHAMTTGHELTIFRLDQGSIVFTDGPLAIDVSPPAPAYGPLRGRLTPPPTTGADGD